MARYQRRGVRTAKPVQLTEAQRRAEGEVTGYKKDPGTPEWIYYKVREMKGDLNSIRFCHRCVLRDFANNFDEIVDSCAWEVIPTDRPYGTVDAMFQAELGISYNEALDLTLTAADPYPEGVAKAAERMATDEIVELIALLQTIVRERG